MMQFVGLTLFFSVKDRHWEACPVPLSLIILLINTQT